MGFAILCVEGRTGMSSRGCRGDLGYREYLAVMADPDDEQHKDYMRWRGQFNPERLTWRA